MALWCGLVANPEKTKPPCQRQLYRGRIYDSSSTPTSIIPTKKGIWEKSLVDYVRDSSVRVCCAKLAILLGVLELLVWDTSHRQRSGFLNHLYKDLHPEGFRPDNIKEGFNKVVLLSLASLQELEWWSHLFPTKLGFRIQPTDLVTLCAT